MVRVSQVSRHRHHAQDNKQIEMEKDIQRERDDATNKTHDCG